ncbi:TetR/AcrR family transcriptional regulator, partial [Oleiphilus sp. HI0079]
MKTKERIILESLDLFNERGERNVSTNHIAAHLNMSPGNLYYHFRNKNEIIYQIFKNYELMVDTYL